MVDNTKTPEQSVRGIFVYQRKKKGDEWIPVTEHSLSSLKSGEGYKLELHCDEVWALTQTLKEIYGLHQ